MRPYTRIRPRTGVRIRPFLALCGLALYACAGILPGPPRTGCGCGSTDPAAPCTGTTVGRSVGGATLELTVRCNGRACQCGQFPLGESWVVPIDDLGVPAPDVQVTAMHTDVSAAVANPTAHDGGQGLIHAAQDPEGTPLDAEEQLKRWRYKAALDIRTQLPYAAAAGTSILSAKTEWHPACADWNGGICVMAADAVTVLGEVPPGAGSTVLRPPFAGTEKPLYPTKELALEKIPRYDLVSASDSWDMVPHHKTVARWNQPFYELCNSATEGYLCGAGGLFRSMINLSALGRNYGADIANSYYASLASVMDDTALRGDKLRAVYALFQRGMDLYWEMRAGANWPYGAGQGPGRKAPIVFFAALVRDPEILSEVQKLSVEHPDWFQESAQLASTSPTGEILWGDRGGWFAKVRERLENGYWSALLGAQCFNGATGTCDPWKPGGLARSFRDIYGFIDGPPVLPGGIYMQCCSTGTFLGYTMVMYMMPELRLAANEERLIRFVEKHFLELGDNTDPAHLTQVKAIVRPDPCAPPTERDSRSHCNAWSGTPVCLDYRKLWGPDPERPGQCIRHGGDPAKDGRFGHLSDTETRQPTYRIAALIAGLWRNENFRETTAACRHEAQEGLCPVAPPTR